MLERATTTTALTILCTAALIANASSVLAQDALGGGNVLDSNLSATGGRINAPRAQESVRDRNLIVTGDVAGGRGFRGSVGYSAAADFRGRTGSNDIFPFLADSAFSSPALLQLGSTYEQLRFGQTAGALEYRRAQSGSPASINAQTPVPFNELGDVVRGDRQRIIDRTSLANSASFNMQRMAEPQVIGVTYDDENRPLLFNASPLRGITVEPMGQNVNQIGLSTLDAARLRQDMEAGLVPPTLGAPFQTPFQVQSPFQRDEPAQPLPGADMRVGGGPQGGRVDGSLQADYARILERVAEQYAEARKTENVDPNLLKSLQDDYNQMRQMLHGVSSPRQNTRVGEPVDSRVPPPLEPGLTDPARSPQNQQPGGGQPPQTVPGATRSQPLPGQTPGQSPAGQLPGQTPSQMPDSEDVRSRLPREMGSALRHGERIERLSGEQQDRLNELIESAEKELREGDYFLAERKFERALRFVPGHPLATVGSAHAQIGGGLYLSAALSLRNLMTMQPEMIDVVFAADLLPARQRLDAAITTLRANVQGDRERAGYAFLLAYIGHQIGERALIEEGLNIMGEVNSGDPLLPMLREIWLTPRPLRNSPPTPPEPSK